MTAHLLLIEDEANIARVLQLELQHEGYAVDRADNGVDGLNLAMSRFWDLIVLDVMLPQMDGMALLKRLRQAGKQTPVLLLTAKDQVGDKVRGLDLGANDYMTKPFAIEELLARIRNLLRTFSSVDTEAAPLQIMDLTVDPLTRLVNRGGKTVELTPREFDLLLYLMKHRGIAVTREQLLSEVWGFDFAGQTNLVDVYIRYLRQKIDRGRPVKLIQTVRGVGYRLADGE